MSDWRTDGEAILGNSPVFLEVLEVARKISKSATTVLILGESGTGKELIARYIHRCGGRASKPFIDVNCGAIPETLLEAELFGYEKGSFTDAKNQKQGLLELARGGTIFLDEIGNMSLNIQAKLLKVIERKCFRRLGGLDEITVDVRIITATNVDLEAATREGRFRGDLLYRLNVVPVVLPPLRDRREDVVPLATHFIKEINQEFNSSVEGLSEDAREKLLNYCWPGNVRQLRNVLERAILLESERLVEADHLELTPDRERRVVSQTTGADQGDTEGQRWNFQIPPEGISLEEVERDLILSAIQTARGNLSKAARLLHISREKIRYRVKKLSIEV